VSGQLGKVRFDTAGARQVWSSTGFASPHPRPAADFWFSALLGRRASCVAPTAGRLFATLQAASLERISHANAEMQRSPWLAAGRAEDERVRHKIL
jgi:hypothetical protein